MVVLTAPDVDFAALRAPISRYCPVDFPFAGSGSAPIGSGGLPLKTVEELPSATLSPPECQAIGKRSKGRRSRDLRDHPWGVHA